MTAAIDGPRLVRSDEFREAMELTERCFGFETGGLEARMPHCFDESNPDRHAIIKRNGAVVSHVACVPVALHAGEARVECAGIAGVATDPDYRGNGYMTQLIEFWLDRLDQRGVPLAELEGDRQGYGRFGWENAGREDCVRIARRTVPTSPPGADRVRRYRGPSDLDLVSRIHERERYRVGRDRSQYERLFAQRDLETLVFEGDRPAYLAYQGSDPASVLEFGGSREGITALISAVVASADELEVFTHPHHPLVSQFYEMALDWKTVPHRKLNLLDLRATIEAYGPLLAERWVEVVGDGGVTSGSVTLAIDGEAGTNEGVTIAYDGPEVRVEPADREPDLEFDRRTMTRLLFGPPDTCWSIKRSFPFLRAVLPLEYYFWQTETI